MPSAKLNFYHQYLNIQIYKTKCGVFVYLITQISYDIKISLLHMKVKKYFYITSKRACIRRQNVHLFDVKTRPKFLRLLIYKKNYPNSINMRLDIPFFIQI